MARLVTSACPSRTSLFLHGFPLLRPFNFNRLTSLLSRNHLLGFDCQLRKLRGISAMGEIAHIPSSDQLEIAEIPTSDQLEVGIVVPATQVHVYKAVNALRAGEVIAVPTDTLYGLACDACSPEAIQRIYEIKGRRMTSPLAVCVSDVLDFDRFAVTSHLPDGFLESLLPGPVTIVLHRGHESQLEKSLNPRIDTIGIRIPECDFIRMVACEFGSAIALTSANQSGQPSTVSIEEFKPLWQQCAYVFDGGQIPAGRAGSTIIDLTRPNLYRILRPGSAFEETVQVLGSFGFKEASELGKVAFEEIFLSFGYMYKS